MDRHAERSHREERDRDDAGTVGEHDAGDDEHQRGDGNPDDPRRRIDEGPDVLSWDEGRGKEPHCRRQQGEAHQGGGAASRDQDEHRAQGPDNAADVRSHAPAHEPAGVTETVARAFRSSSTTRRM